MQYMLPPKGVPMGSTMAVTQTLGICRVEGSTESLGLLGLFGLGVGAEHLGGAERVSCNSGGVRTLDVGR